MLGKNVNGTGYYVKSGPASINSNNKVTVDDIYNTPLIDLSGNVWKDAQIGEKEVSGPNGIKDGTEKGIKDIIVELYDIKNNKVTTTSTDANGNYKFENIDKTKEGYKIIFKYNGIKYNATTTEQGVSEGTEIDRQAFNDDFKTISNGQSNAVQGLTYTYSDEKSVLNATDAGHTTGTTDAKFQIKAETPVYYDSRSDANLGLIERYFDLAVGTDVKSATLKINDKETTYNYAQIMNGEMEDLSLDNILQNNSSTSEVNYNLYLYTSDYNYRISDYKTGDEAIKNTVNPDDNTVNNYENLKELEAYVTYSVILKNQTTYNATVEQFVYYYDAAYIPQFKVNDVIDGYKVVSIENNKITFESVNAKENILKEANSYRKEIDLTFKVSPDANGNITTKTATNVAEITKYSTAEGGLIDKDSAPDNANVTFENGAPKVRRYEDDTDEAKGINISVKEDKIRTITGTVWNDGRFNDADGIKQDGEDIVNDVIVQLIEIKKISGKYYEYIWQETRSGSNQVKTTARNGYAGETYTNSVAEGSGMYEFKHYIPGNYIIRFIYGDGTAYDLTDNVKTYNGQDYKSTIDANYNEAWYNTAGYTEGQSVARDNEARRLEVMAYSSTIDQTIGQSLENRTKDDLKNTWMCAETSRINVPVDADDKATASDSTTASYDYTKDNKKVEFGNVNFGLALRPETKLILEKHITGLKITPNGTGVQPIVDATADIEQIINGTTVDTKGVTSGLATIKSERNERGFWKVETDIEELAQGAQLEVEYTYVIRNESDEDYLSETLEKAYEDQDIKSYTESLSEIKDNVKVAMKNGTYSYSDNNQIGTYLGQYYYNGNSEGCAEVLSRVEELEEALNNQLKYDETVSGEDFEKANTEAVSKNIYDTDGNLVDNVTNGTKNIETVVKTTSTSDFLTRVKENEEYHDNTIKDDNGKDKEVVPNADYSKTLKLTTVLTSFNNGAGYYPSYIAEITKYSNAAGRRNMEAEPANLSYVHSEDTGKTIATYNEVDEFWGEQIIISKPTGFNKQLAIQITIVTISSIAVIGVGIVLIKKFVLKK